MRGPDTPRFWAHVGGNVSIVQKHGYRLDTISCIARVGQLAIPVDRVFVPPASRYVGRGQPGKGGLGYRGLGLAQFPHNVVMAEQSHAVAYLQRRY